MTKSIIALMISFLGNYLLAMETTYLSFAETTLIEDRLSNKAITLKNDLGYFENLYYDFSKDIVGKAGKIPFTKNLGASSNLSLNITENNVNYVTGQEFCFEVKYIVDVEVEPYQNGQITFELPNFSRIISLSDNLDHISSINQVGNRVTVNLLFPSNRSTFLERQERAKIGVLQICSIQTKGEGREDFKEKLIKDKLPSLHLPTTAPNPSSISAFAIQPSCIDGTAQSDGYLQLSAVTDGTHYHFLIGLDCPNQICVPMQIEIRRE